MSRSRLNNTDKFDQLFESIEKISPPWTDVAHIFVEELFKLEDRDRLDPEDFEDWRSQYRRDSMPQGSIRDIARKV
jgi:hypothetical protein